MEAGKKAKKIFKKIFKKTKKIKAPRECFFCNHVGVTKLRDYEQLYFCGNCDTTFVYPMPTDKELAEYYSSQYWENAGSPNINYIPNEMTFRSNIFKKFAPNAKTLCDIGCGYGLNLRGYAEDGFEVEGLEYSKNAVKYIKEELGLNAKQGSIRDLNTSFDIVTINHMIEHSNNSFKDLQHVLKFINPNGLLFVSVPNFNSLVAKNLKSKWEWFSDRDHLFYFTLDSFKYFAEANNLEIVYARTNQSGSKPTAEFLEDHLKHEVTANLSQGLKSNISDVKDLLENLAQENRYHEFETFGFGESLDVLFRKNQAS